MQWNTLPCLIQYFVFVCQSFFSIIKSFFTLMAIGDRRIGPSCWGSPAKTSCPPPGVSVLNSPARGTRHSGCRQWPASSMNTWVKCCSGISPDTNLGKKRRDYHRSGNPRKFFFYLLVWPMNDLFHPVWGVNHGTGSCIHHLELDICFAGTSISQREIT